MNVALKNQERYAKKNKKIVVLSVRQVVDVHWRLVPSTMKGVSASGIPPPVLRFNLAIYLTNIVDLNYTQGLNHYRSMGAPLWLVVN